MRGRKLKLTEDQRAIGLRLLENRAAANEAHKRASDELRDFAKMCGVSINCVELLAPHRREKAREYQFKRKLRTAAIDAESGGNSSVDAS